MNVKRELQKSLIQNLTALIFTILFIIFTWGVLIFADDKGALAFQVIATACAGGLLFWLKVGEFQRNTFYEEQVRSTKELANLAEDIRSSRGNLTNYFNSLEEIHAGYYDVDFSPSKLAQNISLFISSSQKNSIFINSNTLKIINNFNEFIQKYYFKHEGLKEGFLEPEEEADWMISWDKAFTRELLALLNGLKSNINANQHSKILLSEANRFKLPKEKPLPPDPKNKYRQKDLSKTK